MEKNKQQGEVSKESLINVLEDTNQPRARFYSLIARCSISIYKKKEDEMELIALQADSRYLREFCTRVIQHHSIEERAIKTVYYMGGDWVKKIKLIWYDREPADDEVKKLLSYGTLMMPSKENGDKHTIFVQRNRRWNQVIIHIF